MAQVSGQPDKEETCRDTNASDDKTPTPFPQASHTTQSVLDAHLEALALGHSDLASLLLSSKSAEGAPNLGFMLEADLSLFKRKGPNSLLGTGSSVASASDHEVSSSDFESDSGIENSHAEVHSPEMSAGCTKLGAKKEADPFLEVMPHDDLAMRGAAGATNQSDAGEKSCDMRIESFIQCLDNKVDTALLGICRWHLGEH